MEKRMYFIFKVLFVMCVLLGERVSGDGDRQLFRNIKSDSCPYGVVYRSGCNMCFCIRLFNGREVVKCKTRFTTVEMCKSASATSHCSPSKLLYDYNRKCEGKCSCNEARNLTTCENLPCDDTLLWFHGYYNESDKGHPVRKEDVENEIEPALRAGDDDNGRMENDATLLQKSEPARSGRKHNARRPNVLEVKTVYFDSEDDGSKSNKPSRNRVANRMNRNKSSRFGQGGAKYHNNESGADDELPKRRNHRARRSRRQVQGDE